MNQPSSQQGLGGLFRIRRSAVVLMAVAASLALSGCGLGGEDRRVLVPRDPESARILESESTQASSDDGVSDDDNAASPQATTAANDQGTTSTTSSATSSTTTPLPSTTLPSTTLPSTKLPSTTAPPTDSADDDQDLPGEPFYGYTQEGVAMAVIGVAFDDSLNIRVRPDATSDVLDSAPPLANTLVQMGRARSVPDDIWFEIGFEGTVGWVNSRFVGYIGGTDDATAEFLAGNSRPTTETMLELGQVVADYFASNSPATVRQSGVAYAAAGTDTLGEVTFDVVGISDDSVAGFRLRVFGSAAANGEGFTLEAIERTMLCQRGPSGGLCP